MSTLRDYARKELILLGEDATVIEYFDRVLEAFVSFGHSGGSASVMIPRLCKLLNYEPLSPLTYLPEEWNDMSYASGVPMWQNNRDFKVFSRDGGKTHYRLDD